MIRGSSGFRGSGQQHSLAGRWSDNAHAAESAVTVNTTSLKGVAFPQVRMTTAIGTRLSTSYFACAGSPENALAHFR